MLLEPSGATSPAPPLHFPSPEHLNDAQRAALARLACVGTILGRRGEWRLNWADHREQPIDDLTMAALEQHELVRVDHRPQWFSTARLTRKGVIYVAMVRP